MNKNIDINVLLENLKIQTPDHKLFISSDNGDHQTFFLNDNFSSSVDSTPTASGCTSINTTPGTPEAVRITGGISPIPLDILDKLSTVIRKKSSTSTDSYNVRELEYMKRRDNKVKELRNRTIKNPILRKFFGKKTK
uniref:KID domain-containing protein n=1 Tax=Parastrongyloides trichosuri TaxID=131310 RepID=A0A0N4ZXG2_PARTI